MQPSPLFYLIYEYCSEATQKDPDQNRSWSHALLTTQNLVLFLMKQNRISANLHFELSRNYPRWALGIKE